MTVTIRLPPEIEAGLLAQAQAQGLDVSDYIGNLVRNQVVHASGTTMVAHTPSSEESPEEWVRRLRAWSQSHASDNLPILSDDAMSRESIYADRGL